MQLRRLPSGCRVGRIRFSKISLGYVVAYVRAYTQTYVYIYIYVAEAFRTYSTNRSYNIV